MKRAIMNYELRIMTLIIGLISYFIIHPSSLLFAGYTVHVDQQRPEFVQVNGPYGRETYPASAEVPSPPTLGAELCRPANYSPFAAESVRRSRVFSDTYGVADLAAILAVCPEFRQGMIERARRDVSTLLAQTDYMVIKEVEIAGYVMPAEIKAQRQALRDRFNAYEQAVNNAATIDALLAITWGSQ